MLSRILKFTISLFDGQTEPAQTKKKSKQGDENEKLVLSLKRVLVEGVNSRADTKKNHFSSPCWHVGSGSRRVRKGERTIDRATCSVKNSTKVVPSVVIS